MSTDRLNNLPDDSFPSCRNLIAAFLLAVALVAVVIVCTVVSL